MDDLIANPWIVGIGGGVISSLIVFFITKFFLSKKENKEYEQKVRLATNEVVYAVRPLVIDKAIPANDVLAALRSAIAVKYGVKVSDVIGIKQLVSILVLEILSNSFLNSSQKNEYCNLLMTMKDEPKQTPSNDVHKRKSERNLYTYRSNNEDKNKDKDYTHKYVTVSQFYRMRDSLKQEEFGHTEKSDDFSEETKQDIEKQKMVVDTIYKMISKKHTRINKIKG